MWNNSPIISDFSETELPAGIPVIQAMSTEPERRYFYSLASRHSGQGSIVEIGPWLGASTAYIAAGLRDSRVPAIFHVYDQFAWRRGAGVKWIDDKRANGESFLEEFKGNLGPLAELVQAHQVGISEMTWDGAPVELLFLDAPKRLREISKVLTLFGPALLPGVSIMVWQDFLHFPSFEIPAALSRLKGRIEPIHAVKRGTTLGFKVTDRWAPAEVSERALNFSKWSPDEVDSVWEDWIAILPSTAHGLFRCGAIMLLHDIGWVQLARERLRALLKSCGEEIMPKWRSLEHTTLPKRYPALFEEMARVA